MMTHWISTLPWFSYLNFQQKELYHAVRFEKETRYYVIQLEKDLLGDWIITVSNGRIQSRLGQTRIIAAFLKFTEAFEHFCLLVKKRHQRGYHLTTYQSDDLLHQQMLVLCSTGNPVTSLAQKHSAVARAKRTQSPLNPGTTTPSSFQELQQMSFAF